jgi:polyphosphate kinase
MALAEDRTVPFTERVEFAAIMGMLYDEFAMKRIGGLRRRIERKNPLVGGHDRQHMVISGLSHDNHWHGDRQDLMPSQLSGGMKKRVAVARAPCSESGFGPL